MTVIVPKERDPFEYRDLSPDRKKTEIPDEEWRRRNRTNLDQIPIAQVIELKVKSILTRSPSMTQFE